MSRTKNAWINGFFFIFTLVVNGLGAAGLISGFSQKEISDMYITLITPAPSTFSIWSVIYILLLTSIIVMIVKKDDPYYQKAIDGISGLFRLSCLLNIAWIVIFSFLMIELSSLFILGFVITLSVISRRLKKISDRRHFLLPLTFGLYTGWLFIATVVNVASALVKLEWSGFGIAPEIWSIITLAVAIILVLLVTLNLRNAVFPLPIAWAYFGIYSFLKAPEGFNGDYELLQTVSILGIIVLIGVAVLQLYRNKFSLLSEKPKEA